MFTTPSIICLTLWLLWVLQSAMAMRMQYMFRKRLFERIERIKDQPLRYNPNVVIISAIKGIDDNFYNNIKSLTTQNYPRYRIIFATESADDPAAIELNRINAELQSDSPPWPTSEGFQNITVITAGLSTHSSQKVHNQLSTFKHITPDDQVILFADADAAPDENWVRNMSIHLSPDTVGAVTTYRWLIPTQNKFAQHIASIINSAVAAFLGPARNNYAWGGAMALRYETLIESKLEDHWRGAFTDDYQLTYAIRKTGKKIKFVAECMPASLVNYSWSSMFEFGMRQYTITLIYAPFVWLFAFFMTAFYTAALFSLILAVATQAPGFGYALLALLLVLVFDQLRVTLRKQAAAAIYNEQTLKQLNTTFTIDRFASPIVIPVHLLVILGSLTKLRIGKKGIYHSTSWARIKYNIHGRQDVTVVSRPPTQN